MQYKFYAACNGIMYKCKNVNEFVKLGPVKSYCLPLLTYFIGAFVPSVLCAVRWVAGMASGL